MFNTEQTGYKCMEYVKNDDNKKPDRRVQRTQQQLRDALIALILEKGYEAITVQDIIDRANVGRSTFYSHFWDKDQLLLSGFELVMSSLKEQHSENIATKGNLKDKAREISLLMFQHVGSHHGLYLALIGKRGGNLALKQIHEYFMGLVHKNLKELAPGDKISNLPAEIVIHFLVSSLISLLNWWLDNDRPHTPEEMSEIFYQLAVQNLST
jgi:AcrR family transcriptional regulator